MIFKEYFSFDYSNALFYFRLREFVRKDRQPRVTADLLTLTEPVDGYVGRDW